MNIACQLPAQPENLSKRKGLPYKIRLCTRDVCSELVSSLEDITLEERSDIKVLTKLPS